MLRIDVRSSRELQALILSIRQANKEIQKEIRTRTKPIVQTAWHKALAQEAMTRFEHRVLVDTARVAVSNQNVKLKAGGLAKKLSGGGRARDLYGPAEFGATYREARQRYRDHGNGTATKARRGSTGRQFRPRNPKGYVVYPAAARISPRLAALWTQTAVRTFYEALEKKG